MPFNPTFTITSRINKAFVEIERIRVFLDAVKGKLNSGLLLAGNGIFQTEQ